MVANTPNSENTFTNPQFQAFYTTFMLYPRLLGILFFEGANISKFLKKFENMYDNY